MPAELVGLVEPAVEAVARAHGIEGVWAATRDVPYVDICPPGLKLPGGAVWERIHRVRHEDPVPGPDDRLPQAFDRLPYPDTVYVTLGTVVNSVPGLFAAVLAGLALFHLLEPQWMSSLAHAIHGR